MSRLQDDKLKWDTIVPIWDKPPGGRPAAMCFLDVVTKVFQFTLCRAIG